MSSQETHNKMKTTPFWESQASNACLHSSYWVLLYFCFLCFVMLWCCVKIPRQYWSDRDRDVGNVKKIWKFLLNIIIDETEKTKYLWAIVQMVNKTVNYLMHCEYNEWCVRVKRRITVVTKNEKKPPNNNNNATE